MIAYWTIETGDPDLNMLIGIRNSYDKSCTLGLGAGAQVIICENGSFSADYARLRKHTGNIQGELDDMVQSTVASMEKNFIDIKEDMEIMRDMPIDSIDVSHIIGELLMGENILRTQQINVIKKGMRSDINFRMLKPEEMNMWNLYNNVTEALKLSTPANSMQNHIMTHKTIMQHVDRKVNNMEVEASIVEATAIPELG